MVWKNQIICLLFALGPFIGPYAQQTDYQTKRFTVKDGLSSPKINVLHEDQQQQLWIGTNAGLTRYNGYDFKHFSLKEGLESEVIEAITEDEEGYLWAGGNKGIVIVKGDSCYSLPTSILGNTYFLNRDAEGNIWVSNSDFLYYYPKEKIAEFHTTKVISDLNPTLFQPQRLMGISAMTQDNAGNIYVSNRENIFRIDSNKSVERLYHKKSTQPIASELFAWSRDSLFWGDKTGNIHLSTSDSTQLLKAWCNNELCGLVAMEKWNNTLALLFDQRILFYKNDGSQFENLIPESWGIKGRRCMLTDQKGNLWLGTTEGLVLVTLRKFHNKGYPKRLPEIYAIADYDQGLLLGTNQGKVFTYKGDGFPLFNNTQVRPAGEILDIMTDHAGGIWFLSLWRGLARYADGRMQGFFYGDFSAEEPDLYCIIEDKDQCIWLGGLNRIYKISMDWARGTPEEIKEIYLPKRNFNKLVQDKQGVLWAVSSNGLFRIEQDTLLLVDLEGIPANTNFTDALWDGDQLWLTSQGAGLIHCEKGPSGALEIVQSFTVDNGLSNNFVQCIAQDDQQNIWVGTYMGVSKVNANNFIVHNFDPSELIEQSYFNITLHQGRDGQMWCATTEGLFSFDPNSFEQLGEETASHFAKIQVNDSYLGNYAPQTFSHDENSFKFSFLSVNTAHANLTLYSYRLNGLRDEWSSPDNLREVRYDFLPPGNYEFEVKTSNAQGEWSPNVLRYTFIIKPPIWTNVWLRLLVLAILYLSVRWFVNQRIQKIKRQELEKSKARQLITELESKALRAQMNPHFIFNCMNAIQEQILLEKVESAFSYLSKFAQLMRMILDVSTVHALTIEKEMTMLNLYLELESLRFNSAFAYSVECDEEVSFLKIPSLMIQPFVENAIWHGLLPQEKEKRLRIHFSIQENDIVCTIEDNGIGRAASALRKHQHTNEHQSYAIQLIKERLALIRKNDNNNATLLINDLMTETQKPAGTLVKIIIPIYWQNYWNNESGVV